MSNGPPAGCRLSHWADPPLKGRRLLLTKTREEILNNLADGVVHLDEGLALRTAREAIASGLDPYDAINSGLVIGMTRAGELYEAEEYFVPQLLICSDTFHAGLDVLRPRLKKGEGQDPRCVRDRGG